MKLLILAALLSAMVAFPAMPQEAPNPIQRHNVNTIWFDKWIGLSDAMLRVSGPDGKITTIRESTRSPAYRLTGRVVDGFYRYELRAATKERVPQPKKLMRGLEDNQNKGGTMFKPFYRTGAFVVKNGVIVTPVAEERATSE